MLDVNASPARSLAPPTEGDVAAFLAGSAAGFTRAQAIDGLRGAAGAVQAARAEGETDPEVLRSDAVVSALGAMRVAVREQDLADALVMVDAVRDGLRAVARQAPERVA